MQTTGGTIQPTTKYWSDMRVAIALDGVLDDGKTLSQGSHVVTEGHSIICESDGVQAPSSWFRRFSLADLKDTEAFSVNSVSFGVESISLPAGRLPRTVDVKVRVYHYPKDVPLTWAGLQAAPPPVHKAWSVQVQPTSGGYVTAWDLKGFGGFRRSEDMVVEVFYPGGVPGEGFVIGSNAAPVTEFGFHRYTSPSCDANGDGRVDESDNEITPTWKLRTGNPMQVVIEVNGDFVPVVNQEVTAKFDGRNEYVVGTVSTGGSSCLGSVPVRLYDSTGALRGSGQSIASPNGSPRPYEILTSGIADGTSLYVIADAYADRTNQGANIAYCAASAPAFLTKADRDGDGVHDNVDACPDVAPTVAADSLRGCPVVRRQVTASYAAGVVSGDVTVQRPAGVPLAACAGAVTVQVRNAGTGALLGSKDTDDGSYSVALGTQAEDGLSLKALLNETNHLGQALCLEGVSQVVNVVRDSDGDGLRDNDDDCPDVAPPIAADSVRGCPIVHRQVTASYAAGVVSGKVSFTDPPTTACAAVGAARTRVEVWAQLFDNDPGTLLKSGYFSPADGTYSVDVTVPAGRRYYTLIPGWVDGHAWYCGDASSGVKRAPADPDGDSDDDGVLDAVDACDAVDGPGTSDGCPLVDRQFVDVEYGGGAVSGALSVKDSTVGGCAAAKQVSVTPGAGGGPAYGEAAETTGVFTIPVALSDRDVYVLEAGRYLDPAAGWCGDVRTEATAVVDTDGDEVRDADDACAHLEGDHDDDPAFSGCPTLPRTVTASYDDGEITGLVTTENSDACGHEAAMEVVVSEADGTEQAPVAFRSGLEGVYALGEGVGAREALPDHSGARAGPERSGGVRSGHVRDRRGPGRQRWRGRRPGQVSRCGRADGCPGLPGVPDAGADGHGALRGRQDLRAGDHREPGCVPP